MARRESLLKIVGNRQYSAPELQAMMERKNRYYVESIQTITPQDVLPGVLDLLAELRQAGIKIAIGSASKNARTVIEKLGIADRVDAIVDGSSVDQPKPAPDIFLHAAKLLGLDPAHCVVVEDAAAGIEAAIAAGMWSIKLGSVVGGASALENRLNNAHIILPNLIGIHWNDLQSKLG